MKRLKSGASLLALGALAFAAPVAAQAQDQQPAPEKSKRLKAVTVTATKVEETAQDIPVAVQAVDGETLDDLNVGNFDDYLKQLPSVSSGGRGPGQNTVYIRGMAVQPITVLLSGAQGTVPNVAMYLDEQPITAPGRNLDVYATDLERIEVLPGPQGTLFGASSQAGTIRLITNKPVLDEFQAGMDAEYSITKDGEPSTGLEGYVNIPVIEDKLAFRAALYSVNLGGYIDNKPGTFTLDPSINPDSNATPDAVSYETANNNRLVEEDFNDSSYEGIRLGATYAINNDWTATAQYSRQKLEADGVFDYDPEVGDLAVNRFFEDSLDDEFEQGNLTIEGRIAMLDVVYTGSFLDRSIDQSVDYTGYNNSGAFIDYYTCTYASGNAAQAAFVTPGGRECLDPVKGAIIDQTQTRNTHEFRFSTPQDYRFRVTAGVFYDDFELETVDDFYYFANFDGTELGFAPNAPMADAVQIDPRTRPSSVAFFNDIRRTEEQVAFFGEATYDLIPDTLSATVGLRVYDIESDFEGSSNFANGIFATPDVALDDLDSGRDYDVSGGHTDEPLTTDGEVFRANLSWTPDADKLFYATYSEGFRPGGWNRGGGLPSNNPAFPTVSATYDTDDVKNYELGWKTLLLDGNLQFNGNVYFVEWTDMQVSRFDPENVSILTFIENAADSEIFGVEGDVAWAATDNLTLFGAFSYNDTELKSVDAQIAELAPVGSQLPLVPELQLTGRARYEWMVGEYDVYAQGGFQYAGKSYSSLIQEIREEQDSYITADAAVGFGKEQWRAELFVENLTDERTELFINEQDDIRRITTSRPRTIGLRLSYDY
ncbi:TonB-dependent receptor [Henriciella aquimarina]|uniref:TonB-dependent receptor n=1 Tax=Henriciella aquimarina TaxID=545261 RepID=UPI000A0319A1|nr:TonB-dependent receptor plug domain-containing protein [Henriciella aquimarina]